MHQMPGVVANQRISSYPRTLPDAASIPKQEFRDPAGALGSAFKQGPSRPRDPRPNRFLKVLIAGKFLQLTSSLLQLLLSIVVGARKCAG
jgi:hypothetical protein